MEGSTAGRLLRLYAKKNPFGLNGSRWISSPIGLNGAGLDTSTQIDKLGPNLYGTNYFLSPFEANGQQKRKNSRGQRLTN